MALLPEPVLVVPLVLVLLLLLAAVAEHVRPDKQKYAAGQDVPATHSQDTDNAVVSLSVQRLSLPLVLLIVLTSLLLLLIALGEAVGTA